MYHGFNKSLSGTTSIIIRKVSWAPIRLSEGSYETNEMCHHRNKLHLHTYTKFTILLFYILGEHKRLSITFKKNLTTPNFGTVVYFTDLRRGDSSCSLWAFRQHSADIFSTALTVRGRLFYSPVAFVKELPHAVRNLGPDKLCFSFL